MGGPQPWSLDGEAPGPVPPAKPDPQPDRRRQPTPPVLRGSEEGSVRPADDRYLTDQEIAKRDAYVARVTGDNAQQLVAKRAEEEEATRQAEATSPVSDPVLPPPPPVLPPPSA